MIEWAFTSTDSPACYSNPQNVLAEVRKKFPKTTLDQVLDVLQRLDAYTLHRARKRPKPRLMTVPGGFLTDVQVVFPLRKNQHKI